jgi:branched-chain amino acid transport system substrate-binding protein
MTSRRLRSQLLGSLAVASLLLLAACSSSAKSKSQSASSSESTAASVASAASGSVSAAPANFNGFTATDPLKIAFMWYVQGESSTATNNYDQAGSMAVDYLNQHGGVGGKPVQSFREATDPYDVQQARGAFLKAVGEKPSATIGWNGAVAEGLTRDFASAAIPNVNIGFDDNTLTGGSSASPYFFQVLPPFANDAQVAVKFANATFSPKRVGLIYTTSPGNTEGANAIKKELAAANIPLVATQSVAVTAPDMTPSVLALKNANVDTILLSTDPAVFLLTMKAIAQNGMTVPVIEDSGSAVLQQPNLDAAATAHLYSVGGCDPGAGNAPAVDQQFTADFKAKYGRVPTQYEAKTYDGVLLIAAAAAQAKSTDPAAMLKAFNNLKFTGGICSQNYATGSDLAFDHHNIVTFLGENPRRIVYETDLPPLKQ